jgi:hypothetical protein
MVSGRCCERICLATHMNGLDNDLHVTVNFILNSYKFSLVGKISCYLKLAYTKFFPIPSFAVCFSCLNREYSSHPVLFMLIWLVCTSLSLALAFWMKNREGVS